MPNWVRLALVTLSIGGGFMGMTLTAGILFRHGTEPVAELLIGLIFLALYGLLILSGLILVQNRQNLKPLAAAFLLQVPVISSPAMTYRFSGGIYTPLLFGVNGVKWFIWAGAEWYFSILRPAPVAFGFNVFAVGVFAYLVVQILRQRNPDARSGN
ncbi:MAG TPA: hypothetical protein VF595_07170 [Tepidisphaeraceae bacterium]|jgi:hypothetical protein